MGLKDFSNYPNTGKSLFRVYKKINKKVFQEYYKDFETARNRQDELDSLVPQAGSYEHFLFETDINKALNVSNNIGCRYVSFQIATKKNSRPNEKHRLEMRVHGTFEGRILSKTFGLSNYGWPFAMYEAVEFAMECYNTFYPNALSEFDRNCVRDWVRDEHLEDSIASKMWQKMADRGPSNFTFSTDVTSNNHPRYISVRKTDSGKAELRINATEFDLKRGKYTETFSQFYGYLSYFTYLVIKNFDSGEKQDRYMLAVYFMLVTTWGKNLREWSIPTDRQLGSFHDFVETVYSYIE